MMINEKKLLEDLISALYSPPFRGTANAIFGGVGYERGKRIRQKYVIKKLISDNDFFWKDVIEMVFKDYPSFYEKIIAEKDLDWDALIDEFYSKHKDADLEDIVNNYYKERLFEEDYEDYLNSLNFELLAKFSKVLGKYGNPSEGSYDGQTLKLTVRKCVFENIKKGFHPCGYSIGFIKGYFNLKVINKKGTIADGASCCEFEGRAQV